LLLAVCFVFALQLLKLAEKFLLLVVAFLVVFVALLLAAVFVLLADLVFGGWGLCGLHSLKD